MRVVIVLLIAALITSCNSTKIINDKEQNFFEYVIMNKNSNDKTYQRGMWKTNSDMFPGIRLKKWLSAEEVTK